jgi:hypothetical protein
MVVVRVRLAREENSSENSPHYREANKSTNVRDGIEKNRFQNPNIRCELSGEAGGRFMYAVETGA